MPRTKKTTTEETTVEETKATTKKSSKKPIVWEDADDLIFKKRIKIIFIEEILGSCTTDPEIYSKFIAGEASDMDRQAEIEALGGPDEAIEQGTTRFLMVDDKPALSNHTWLGLFKEKCGFLKMTVPNSTSASVSNYKKKLDNGIGFESKFSILVAPKGKTTSINQRSLRASTAKGERIALASSVTCPAGTRTRFTVYATDKVFLDVVEEALNIGRVFCGTGQWRGSGKKGRFLWEELAEDGKTVIGGNTKRILGVTTNDGKAFKEALDAYIASENSGEIEEEFE